MADIDCCKSFGRIGDEFFFDESGSTDPDGDA
eukprot:CAMPEP_0194416202 /NCGR_PEP_ID=MMETSP0176-20130528/15152_1 /TAXON_ID=216777 /ORGANISM="Proboscia alata, Strain PI-D3" /LENGTH=31 /DNA_ID= /DNA_START= /DNA_END= /DNA_ORIENTATION=